MRLELKTLGLWSVIKVSFLVNLVFGFLMGLFYALFLGTIMSALMSLDGAFPLDGYDTETMPIGAMIIILPILGALGNAVFGTLAAFVLALIYNIAARLAGGLEYDVNILDYAGLPGYAPPQTGGYYQPRSQSPPGYARGPQPESPPGYSPGPQPHLPAEPPAPSAPPPPPPPEQPPSRPEPPPASEPPSPERPPERREDDDINRPPL